MSTEHLEVWWKSEPVDYWMTAQYCDADTTTAAAEDKPESLSREMLRDQIVLQCQIMLCKAMLETNTTRRTLARRLGMTPQQFKDFFWGTNMPFRTLSDALVAMGRQLDARLDPVTPPARRTERREAE